MTDEMYNHFGGDSILAELQKFDPNARITDTSTYSGEGGEGPMGKRLDYDVSKLPASKSGIDILNMRTTSGAKEKDGHTFLRDPKAVFDDENYGEITHASNIGKHQDFLDKYGPVIGPLLISIVAPMAAPALFGAMSGGALGAGALGAGFTSGVTSGAAGLGAGSTPGALGAGTFTAADAPGWAKGLAKPSTAQTLGRGLSSAGDGDFDIMKLIPMLASMTGMDPKLLFALTQGSNLAQGKKPGVGSAISLAQLFGK